MFYVYVLISESTGKRYIGQTNDLERRIAEHNCPEHNRRKHTTRNPDPWRLAYCEEYHTRCDAMIREKWLKSTSGRRFLKKEIGRASPSVLPD